MPCTGLRDEEMLLTPAFTAGAIYASIGRELDWKTKRCRGSFEPTSVACRSFQLREPSFAGNLAVYGGGALFVSDPTRVSIAECSIWGSELPLHEVWKQGLLEDFCLQFESNQVQVGYLLAKKEKKEKSVF